MKNRLNQTIFLYFCLIAAVCGGLSLYAGLRLRSPEAVLLCFGAGLLLFSGGILLLRSFQWYLRRLLVQLSDLISSLSSMQENPVFSDLEDDMLGRLQVQAAKLSGVLRAQHEQAARERDEIKSLISDIAHQLKTPLANLTLTGELLEDDSLSPSERNARMDELQGQLQKLTFLMETMIKMSRLESGIIQLRPASGDLRETALAAVHVVYRKAQERRIQLEMEDGPSVLLPHDKNWVAEALFNILDNAVKYTPEGGLVRISLEKYEMFARVDVHDTGPGIPETEIPRIFHRFYRGAAAQDAEGLGLGLFLSREIVSQSGGYIRVTSSPCKGSLFSIFLPLSRPPE